MLCQRFNCRNKATKKITYENREGKRIAFSRVCDDCAKKVMHGLDFGHTEEVKEKCRRINRENIARRIAIYTQ